MVHDNLQKNIYCNTCMFCKFNILHIFRNATFKDEISAMSIRFSRESIMFLSYFSCESTSSPPPTYSFGNVTTTNIGSIRSLHSLYTFNIFVLVFGIVILHLSLRGRRIAFSLAFVSFEVSVPSAKLVYNILRCSTYVELYLFIVFRSCSTSFSFFYIDVERLNCSPKTCRR